MSRYEPLTRYLEGRREAAVPLTFKDVERILNRNLPPSARLHQPWWANTTTHSHAGAWLRIGWKTRQVDLAGQRVVFVKEASGSVGASGERPIKANTSSSVEVVVRTDDLSSAARAFMDRYMTENDCTMAQAVADLLNQAALDRRRRLLDRFPLSGERSTLDSVDLIREDRDAR
jgi:hypothetical protein